MGGVLVWVATLLGCQTDEHAATRSAGADGVAQTSNGAAAKASVEAQNLDPDELWGEGARELRAAFEFEVAVDGDSDAAASCSESVIPDSSRVSLRNCYERSALQSAEDVFQGTLPVELVVTLGQVKSVGVPDEPRVPRVLVRCAQRVLERMELPPDVSCTGPMEVTFQLRPRPRVE